MILGIYDDTLCESSCGERAGALDMDPSFYNVIVDSFPGIRYNGEGFL